MAYGPPVPKNFMFPDAYVAQGVHLFKLPFYAGKSSWPRPVSCALVQAAWVISAVLQAMQLTTNYESQVSLPLS